MFYFSGSQSCVGFCKWVLQRLRQGVKNACPAPKGGARSPPAAACPRRAWPSTSGSDAGTLGREGRQCRSLAEGSCPAVPSACGARAALPVLGAAPASRATLPRGKRAARRDTAASFGRAGHADPVGTGHLPRPALGADQCGVQLRACRRLPKPPSWGRRPTWRDLPPEEELLQHDGMVVLEGEAPADHDVQQHAQGPDGGRMAVVAAQPDPLGRAVGVRS